MNRATIRRPRAVSTCRQCIHLAHERDKLGAILATIVAHMGGSIELAVDRVAALNGTELVIDRTADVWTITTDRAVARPVEKGTGQHE